MTKIWLAILISAAAVATACGGDEPNQCGNGESVTADGVNYCAYPQQLIIEGFQCPEATPHPFTDPGSGDVVCASQPQLPDDCGAVFGSTVELGDSLCPPPETGPTPNSGGTDAGSTDADGTNANNSSSCVPTTLPGECDHFCQTGCEMNQKCVFAGNDPMTRCAPIGTQTQDEVCDSGLNLCFTGYGCLLDETGGSVGTCRKYCRVAAGEPQCDDGQVCQQIPDTDTGLCVTI